MKINLDRAKAGSILEIAEAIWDAYRAGATWDAAVSDVLADKVVEKYRYHIAAALRDKGVDFGDADTLDGDTLRRIIGDRVGVVIESWTPEALKVAFDGVMARQLSMRLGVTVDSVQDIEAVKAALLAAARDAVESGRASAFVSRAMIKKIRAKKAWVENGVPEKEDQQAVRNRWYQKKFRRTHRGVWREV